MEKENLNERWEHFDTEALVKAAIDGGGDKNLIDEAKVLIEDTIEARKDDQMGQAIDFESQ